MERKLFECKRCGHKWLSSKERPILCAKCHSAYWDTPKAVKGIIGNIRINKTS